MIILLPEELIRPDAGLKKIGSDSLADEDLKVLNSAAKDAVEAAATLFVNAVRNITFYDAKSISSGISSSATTY